MVLVYRWKKPSCIIWPCIGLPTLDQKQQQLLLSTIYRRCQNEPQAVDFGTRTEILRQERIRPRRVISLDRIRFFTIGHFLSGNFGSTASELIVQRTKGFYWLFRLVIFWSNNLLYSLELGHGHIAQKWLRAHGDLILFRETILTLGKRQYNIT